MILTVEKCRALLRRHPILALGLVCLVSVGLYHAGWQAWAEWHHRAGREDMLARRHISARAHFKLCLEVRPKSSAIHLDLARAERRAGSLAEAEHWLMAAERLGADVRRERSLLRAQQGDLAEDEAELRRAADRDATEAPIILDALARGYLENYRLDDAHQCLEALLRHRPDDAQACFWHGDVHERRNHLADAKRDFMRALEIDADFDEARVRLGRLLLRSGEADHAAEQFTSILEEQPGERAAWLGLARCRVCQGNPEAAEKILDRVLIDHPDCAEALCERGKLALQSGRQAEAEAYLLRAWQTAPYERETAYNLYQCLLQGSKTVQAREYLLQVERITADLDRVRVLTAAICERPSDPDPRCEVGIILMRNRQEKEGARWLVTALQADSRHRPTLQALAHFYRRTGLGMLAEEFETRAQDR